LNIFSHRPLFGNTALVVNKSLQCRIVLKIQLRVSLPVPVNVSKYRNNPQPQNGYSVALNIFSYKPLFGNNAFVVNKGLQCRIVLKIQLRVSLPLPVNVSNYRNNPQPRNCYSVALNIFSHKPLFGNMALVVNKGLQCRIVLKIKQRVSLPVPINVSNYRNNPQPQNAIVLH
jgi:hypothetical protein